MSRLLLFVALVVLVAALACGGEDATEAPANTPAPPTVAPTATPEPPPTPTPEPTPTLEPTATPAPTPAPADTPTPAPQTEEQQGRETAAADGMITPLKLDDPLNVAGELSEDELACVFEVADPGKLMQIFSALEQASPDDMAQLINCMEDETVLRLFVTGLVGLEEPLSVETSACVREGMDEVDARAVMLSGTAGDEQAAMASSMAAFFLVMTCLNDEEFDAAAPSLGMTAEDRDGLLCVIGELGGPEEFAGVFSAEDEEAMMSLFGAAIACGLEMEGGMAPGG